MRAHEPTTSPVHPAESLWGEHAQWTAYPDGVVPVREAIRGTAFFPGGYGLWNPGGARPLPSFPVCGTMVLGHDFHSVAGYEESLARGAERETQPTWRNLLALLDAAGIARAECFFTNVFMGLREGVATTGTFPGASDTGFVQRCRRFLLRQLDVQRPSLVLTLGVHAPLVLAPLSPDLASWTEGRGLKHLDATGPVRADVGFHELPGYRTAVVALVHPSLRHAGVRHRRYGGETGDAAERRMLRDALAARHASRS